MNDAICYAKGTDQLDEIFLTNVDVHIEQMDTDVYWMSFIRHDDAIGTTWECVECKRAWRVVGTITRGGRIPDTAKLKKEPTR